MQTLHENARRRLGQRGASSWVEARIGQTRVWWRTHGHAAESVMVGNMSLEAAQHLQGQLDALIGMSPDVVGFHDWFDAPTYDTVSRISWQKWLSGKKFAGAHFLTSSRLMRMGIIVANLAYPGVRFAVHATRAEYEVARSAFLPPARRPI
jgi:hypothetical protein